MLIASLIRDAACGLASHGTAETRPSQAEPWRDNPKDGEEFGLTITGMWMGPSEYDQLPRLKVLEGWDPNLQHVTPPFHPICLSTRSENPAFNLTPSVSHGWEHWTHPDYLDKPYLLARQPGSSVTFQLDTSVGIVKMYSLRSRTFGLGSIECWADEDRLRAKRIDGYWDDGSFVYASDHSDNRNIGRFATIRDDLAPGPHNITCELLHETADPEGGHEFRIISMMR